MRLSTALVVVPALYLACNLGLRFSSRAQVERTETSVPSVPADAAAPGSETVESPESTRDRRAAAMASRFPVQRATSPAEVRQVLRLTGSAEVGDRPALLDAALRAQDPLVAGNAVKALGRLGLFSEDESLLALIEDPRQRVRQDAVTACGLDGGTAALPALADVLAGGDPGLRLLALDALGRIGGQAARRLVESVARDERAPRAERVFARAALGRMNS